MKKIGMIVAVEMDAVLRKYGEAAGEKKCGGWKVLTYKAAEYELYVLNCGAGEIAAAAGTQMLISEFGVDMIVNFGVVGGLTEEMSLTRVCVVEKVVHYDFDTSEIDNVEVGRYLDYPSIYIPTTPELFKKALELQPELKKVVCASGDKFVGDPDAKRALHENFGADICEMEAAAITLTCNRHGVPCLLLKAVSDGLTGGAKEFAKELANASACCLEVTDKIIRAL